MDVLRGSGYRGLEQLLQRHDTANITTTEKVSSKFLEIIVMNGIPVACVSDLGHKKSSALCAMRTTHVVDTAEAE